MGSKPQQKRSRSQTKTQIGVKRGNLNTRKGARKTNADWSGLHARVKRLYVQDRERTQLKKEILAAIASANAAVQTALDDQASAARSAEITITQLNARYDQIKEDLDATIERQGRESQIKQDLEEELSQLKAHYVQTKEDLEATRESLKGESEINNDLKEQMRLQLQTNDSLQRAFLKRKIDHDAEMSRQGREIEEMKKDHEIEISRLTGEGVSQNMKVLIDKISLLKTTLDDMKKELAAHSAENTQEVGDAFVQMSKRYVHMKKEFGAALASLQRESTITTEREDEISKLKARLQDGEKLKNRLLDVNSRLWAFIEERPRDYEDELSRFRGEFEEMTKENSRLRRHLNTYDPPPSTSSTVSA